MFRSEVAAIFLRTLREGPFVELLGREFFDGHKFEGDFLGRRIGKSFFVQWLARKKTWDVCDGVLLCGNAVENCSAGDEFCWFQQMVSSSPQKCSLDIFGPQIHFRGLAPNHTPPQWLQQQPQIGFVCVDAGKCSGKLVWTSVAGFNRQCETLFRRKWEKLFG